MEIHIREDIHGTNEYAGVLNHMKTYIVSIWFNNAFTKPPVLFVNTLEVLLLCVFP